MIETEAVRIEHPRGLVVDLLSPSMLRYLLTCRCRGTWLWTKLKCSQRLQVSSVQYLSCCTRSEHGGEGEPEQPLCSPHLYHTPLTSRAHQALLWPEVNHLNCERECVLCLIRRQVTVTDSEADSRPNLDSSFKVSNSSRDGKSAKAGTMGNDGYRWHSPDND